MADIEALTELSTSDLEAILSAVDGGRVSSPLSSTSLVAQGLSRAVDVAPWLIGLDTETLRLLLRAVLAERARFDRPLLELVWTGPEAPASTTRDTWVLVRELLASAEESVLIAGYAFDHGAELFRTLHERMLGRGVKTRMFFDIPGRAPAGMSVEAFADQAVQIFLEKNWPFGDPQPEIYYDPRTAASDAMASLHAKCVVVDGRYTLITSANFTERGQTRNIELGVKVDSAAFAAQVTSQWEGLVSRQWVRESKKR